MIDKQDVIAFFDRCAPTWDENMIRNEEVIRKILDNGGVVAGSSVLDVACGTGVLFQDYLSRNVRHVTAVDISPEMVKIAALKYPESPIQVICGDVEEIAFEEGFDVVMVYNAFPHFCSAKDLIHALAKATKPGGRLSVAHSMSRKMIDQHHCGQAKPVSNGLMSEKELAELFDPWYQVDIMISDEQMYQVSGIRREEQENK